MAILFSDPFTGTLSATNYLDEASPTVWSIDTGELACSTNNFRVLKTTTAAHAAIADVKVSCKRASGASFDGCLLARCTIVGATSAASGSAYYCNFFGTNSFEVGRRIAGGGSTVLATPTLAHVDGDTIAFQVSGTGTVTLKVFVNGVQAGADITDSGAGVIDTAAQTGFFVFNNSSRFDDYQVESLASAGSGFHNRRLGAMYGSLTGGTFGFG